MINKSDLLKLVSDEWIFEILPVILSPPHINIIRCLRDYDLIYDFLVIKTMVFCIMICPSLSCRFLSNNEPLILMFKLHPKVNLSINLIVRLRFQRIFRQRLLRRLDQMEVIMCW